MFGSQLVDSLGGMVSLEKAFQWGWGLSFKNPCQAQSNSLAPAGVVDQGAISLLQQEPTAPCLPAAMLLTRIVTHGLIL